MHTSTLRAVDDSVLLPIPQPLLDALGWAENQRVRLEIRDGRLLAERYPRYTLAELLAQCDASFDADPELREWEAMAPVGRELI